MTDDKNPTNVSKSKKYFCVGVAYFNYENYSKAERWFRYAARLGNKVAKQKLKEGIEKGYFLDINSHLKLFASSILDTLILPVATDEQIKGLEELLLDFLQKNYLSCEK